MTLSKAELIALAQQKAEKYGLEAALVCAIVEQESQWNTWATRYEPAFYERYVVPLNESRSESAARATSWGLMQCMGQVARERGFGGPYLSELCDPDIGLDMGCKHFAAMLAAVGGTDIHAALQRWNGGGNPDYAGQVLARVATYAA